MRQAMIDPTPQRDPIPIADALPARAIFHELSIPRLYAYHRALAGAQAEGKRTVTSHALAELLDHTISSAQIRKDLCALGPLGRRGRGYAINPLVEQLALVLGLGHDWRIAIVGFGFLGHAFATFITARERRFEVVAIFDQAPSVIGQEWQGMTVSDSAQLDRVVAQRGCNIGVIAVPAPVAPAIAQRLVNAGVQAILNFAPTPLHLRTPVMVRNIDLAGELTILTHHLSCEAR